jgi:hypothetical protein
MPDQLKPRASSQAFGDLPYHVYLPALDGLDGFETAQHFVGLVKPLAHEWRLHCLGKGVAEPGGLGGAPTDLRRDCGSRFRARQRPQGYVEQAREECLR